ncbi:MAG: PaaI family thioesterase [Rhodothalassiaceae bacterium]
MACNPDKAFLAAILEGRAEPGPVTSCPAARALGAKLVALDPESGVLEMEFAAGVGHVNGAGVVLGGVIAAMLDLLAAFSVLAFTRAEFPGSIDLQVHFLRPARPGPLRGEAHLVQAGRRIAYTEAALRDVHDRKIARGRSALALR